MRTPSIDSTLIKEAEDPSTTPDRLRELCQNIELCRIIASNRNIDSPIIDALAPRHSLELLSNPSFRALEESGRLLPSLSLASRLSLLIATPENSGAFSRFQIREALIQALRSVSRLHIQRTECWFKSLHFRIGPGVVGNLPTSDVVGRIDIFSEEYGEVFKDLNAIDEEINILSNLQEGIEEILEYNDEASCQDIIDSLGIRLAHLLSALSSGQVDQLVYQGFISAASGRILDEISIENTASESSKCTLASHSSGTLTDDMTIDIGGIVVELRFTDESLLASWQGANGVQEVEIDVRWDPSGTNCDQVNLTLDGLGDLNSLWGWMPCVRSISVPDNWSQYIVHGLIKEVIGNQ